MRLNHIAPFLTKREATLWARARALHFETLGYDVEHFDGLDWIWYCVNIQSSSIDLGITIQILTDPEPGEKNFLDHLNELLGREHHGSED